MVVAEEESYLHAPVALPAAMKAVLFIPDAHLSTAQARGVLPESVQFKDAVYNVGRAALLVASMASGRLSLLKVATADQLHQPYRERLFPAMVPVISAALGVGALGSFLSGAGPTVLSLCTENEGVIGDAMQQAAEGMGVAGVTRVAHPALDGAVAGEDA